jgi:hypothetical protein
MNDNLAINENLYQLEQVILARIAKLRKDINGKQHHIESQAQLLKQLQEEGARRMAEKSRELKTAVKSFSTLFAQVEQQELLNNVIRLLLFAVLQEVVNELPPFFLQEEPDFFDAAEGAEDQASDGGIDDPDTESAADSSAQFGGHQNAREEAAPDAELEAEIKAEHEEFIRFMREKERASALRDPFSRESIEALKQSTDAPDIRKLYLHLSKQTHPDLAVNTDDAARRTAVMQRLSTAYRSGDFAALLAIQESLDIDSFNPSADGSVTEERIASLRITMERLEEQAKILDRHKRRMGRSVGGKFLKMNHKLGDGVFEETTAPMESIGGLLADVVRITQMGIDGKMDLDGVYSLLSDLTGIDIIVPNDELWDSTGNNRAKNKKHRTKKGRK